MIYRVMILSAKVSGTRVQNELERESYSAEISFCVGSEGPLGHPLEVGDATYPLEILLGDTLPSRGLLQLARLPLVEAFLRLGYNLSQAGLR